MVDVVQVGDDGAGTRSVGWHCWHCPLIFLAAGTPPPPPLSAAALSSSSCQYCAHCALCSIMLLCPPCPGGTIWVKATRRCSQHQSTNPSPKNLHLQCITMQCTNPPITNAQAPMQCIAMVPLHQHQCSFLVKKQRSIKRMLYDSKSLDAPGKSLGAPGRTLRETI